MDQIINAELKYFEICLFYGFFLTMTYDFFCILRRLIKHRVYIVTIEDVVYGIFKKKCQIKVEFMEKKLEK